MSASPHASSSASASASASVYDAWLGLIPQFFAQAGVAPTNGAAADLPYPLDQIARAATMTTSALQSFEQSARPALQMAAEPGLLAQWAASIAAPPSIQTSTTGFDRTFGALIDALGQGPARHMQTAMQDVTASAVAEAEARTAYMKLVQGAFVKGFEGLLATLAETASSGARIEGMLPLMKLWAASTEEALHAVLQSEEGLAATAALSRAEVSRKKKLQEVSAIVARGFDLVTRQELDEAFREIQDLKREIRKLRPASRKAGA